MSKISFPDFWKYYKATPNQMEAIVLLESQLPISLLSEDAAWVKKYREPEPVLDCSFVVPKAALDIIAEFEGFVPTVYDDGVGVATIGYGSTFYLNGREVAWGDPPITKTEARDMMENVCEKYFWDVICCELPYWEDMNDNQRSALCSFAYNLGAYFYGSPGFKTISGCLREKRWGDVPAALMLYVNPGSAVEAGLTRRRKAEGELWIA
jgi:GH24 family phage-related lysozyme (muramidase)